MTKIGRGLRPPPLIVSRETMRCFLLGGGESLAGFDFKQLDSEVTIGMNVIFKFYEPRILIWSDPEIYPEHKEDIDKLKSIKYAWQEIINPTYENVLPYKKTEEFYGKEGLAKGLFGGRGTYFTGILAISLAISLEYSPIYLLGYDGGKVKERLHFHNFYEKERAEEVFLNANNNYDVFKDYEIYNCSLQSKITQFPKIDIEKVLNG